MIKYKVIATDSFYDLEERVNQMLQSGWWLEGGIAVVNWQHGSEFYQAMGYLNSVSPLQPTGQENSLAPVPSNDTPVV